MKWIFMWLLPLAALNCNKDKEIETNWSKTFTGTAGTEKVALYLNKGNDYSGYLWLGDYPYPLSLFANPDSSGKNNFQVIASERLISVTINGNVQKNEISGVAIIQREEAADTLKLQLKEDDGSTPFSYHYQHFKKSTGENSRPVTFQFSYGSIWADDASDLGGELKVAIRSLANVHTSTSPDVWMEEDHQTLQKNWETNLKETGSEYAASNEYIKEINVFHEDRSIITLASFFYEYTGGAHGMHYTHLINVDKKTGKALELSDVLSDMEIELLPRILEKVARNRFDAENDKSLKENGFFVDTIAPTGDYYLLENGIGFYYSLYELRPYAEGEVILFVPYEMIKKER